MQREQEQKTLIVRQIEPGDFKAIQDLQLRCFPGMRPWKTEQLQSHLKHFPEGQICVEYDGKVIATSSSLVIDFDEYEAQHSWQDVSDGGYIGNHDPDGDTLYGIEVAVDPEYRGMKVGRRLYDERKKIARSMNLKRIIIGGRLPNYHQYADRMTIHEYVDEVVEKNITDPVLTFQIANGFVLKRILDDYLSSDAESRGYAVLLEWVNLHFTPNPAERTRSVMPVRVCTIQYQMRKIDSFDDFAAQTEFFVDVASGYKCDFALFPEIFTLQLVSYFEHDRPGKAIRELATYTDQYIEHFRRLALQHNINIIAGSHYEQRENHIYNVAYLFRRDGSIDTQEKLHITPNELRWWGIRAGSGIKVFDTDRGKIAINICYDVEFPELARIATSKGANILFVPFCTDNRQGHLRVRYCAQARAIENQIYVVTSGNVGNIPSVENMDVNYAESGIFTPSDFPFPPDGIAGSCQANIETVAIADLDLELLRTNRITGSVRTLRDRRTDLYTLEERDISQAANARAAQMETVPEKEPE